MRLDPTLRRFGVLTLSYVPARDRRAGHDQIDYPRNPTRHQVVGATPYGRASSQVLN
jgi:hypothetical protein